MRPKIHLPAIHLANQMFSMLKTPTMFDLYLIAKALHIIAFVCWFAGLFYLPRLFVYHVNATPEAAKMLNIMQHKLYRYIMYPAGIITTLVGLWLIMLNPGAVAGWLTLKLLLVALLWGYHVSLGLYVKRFAANKNTKSEKFFRLYNEVPTLLLITIVFLAILKPF